MKTAGIWIDARPPEAYEAGRLKNAVNDSRVTNRGGYEDLLKQGIRCNKIIQAV